MLKQEPLAIFEDAYVGNPGYVHCTRMLTSDTLAMYRCRRTVGNPGYVKGCLCWKLVCRKPWPRGANILNQHNNCEELEKEISRKFATLKKDFVPHHPGEYV
jgi:hypothetical protein